MSGETNFANWILRVAKARSRLDFIVFGRGVAWGWVARRRYGGLQRAARDISCVLLLLPSRPFSGDRRLQNTRASTQKGVSLARSPAKERPRRRLCGAVCLGRCDTSSCQCQRAPDRQQDAHTYIYGVSAHTKTPLGQLWLAEKLRRNWFDLPFSKTREQLHCGNTLRERLFREGVCRNGFIASQ
jgi:hypothetical protein